MNGSKTVAGIGALLLSALLPAWGALPPPTPEQQQEAAAKKAKEAAQAEQQKKELAASMERVAERWRSRARAEGWQVHPQVAVEPVQGITASQTQAGPSGQPGGKLGPAAKDLPIRSEKLGTAPPSEDVKKPAPPQAVR